MRGSQCVQANEVNTVWKSQWWPHNKFTPVKPSQCVQANGAITMCASQWCPHNLPPRVGTAHVTFLLPSKYSSTPSCHGLPPLPSGVLSSSPGGRGGGLLGMHVWLRGITQMSQYSPLSHSVHNHKCLSQCGARHWSQMSIARLGHPLFAQLIRLSSGLISVATVSSSSL